MNQILESLEIQDKKALFIAETKFQILNCINIARNSRAICDLFISDFYKDSHEIANKIRRLNIFNTVTVYRNPDGKTKKAFFSLKVEKYLEKVFGDFIYDMVFFSSRDFLTRSALTYIKYIRPQITAISYDEGLGSYLPLMESYTNKIEKNIVKIRFKDSSPNLIFDKILYKPQVYLGSGANIKIYQMPKFDEKMISIMNDIYSYSNEMRIPGDYIYLDNYYDGKDTTTNQVLEILAEKTENSLVIKKHPQTPDGVYPNGVEYEYSYLPFEVIAANTDIENKILVTSISSAVWTPMLLLDKYPTIILLYPLFNDMRAVDVIAKLKKLYKKNQIILINNIDELKSIDFQKL